jgi:ribonuclease VapC
VIVDTSAIIAILREEPEAATLARALLGASILRMSAATYVEASIVLDRSPDVADGRRFDDLIKDTGIRIEAITAADALLARAAHRDFGRGSGHPARLNFGDCFAYALAKSTGEPLLFKGDDFGHTDVRSALA